MIEKFNKKYKFVLGSKSPRRKDLLNQMGLKFKTRFSLYEEVINEKVDISMMPQYLAEQKAESLRGSLKKKEMIITADTLVISDGKILGKPKNKKEAIEMIMSLSGKWHEVTTGMCLMTEKKTKTFSETTQVHFKEMSETEINYYVKEYKPLDKAGAYGIQEWIGLIGVKEIKGCFFNVIGLPVPKFYDELKSFKT